MFIVQRHIQFQAGQHFAVAAARYHLLEINIGLVFQTGKVGAVWCGFFVAVAQRRGERYAIVKHHAVLDKGAPHRFGIGGVIQQIIDCADLCIGSKVEIGAVPIGGGFDVAVV